MVSASPPVNRTMGRVPVVAMDHLGQEVYSLAALQNSLAKEDKPLQVVRVVPFPIAIESLAIKIGVVFNEI